MAPRGTLVILALALSITVPLAPALGDLAPSLAEDAASAPSPIVVIAHIDSGANVYHEAFRDDSPLAQEHPCTYIAGFPCDAEALHLTLDPSLTYEEAVERDRHIWENVTSSTAEDQNLYWVPGTKVVGAIRFGNGGAYDPVAPPPPAGALNWVSPEYPILDEHGHGTMTATRMGGNEGSLCAECRVVIIEGLGGLSTRWAAETGWIDVQTNSWLDLVPPPAGEWSGGAETHPVTQAHLEEDPYATTAAFKYAQSRMLTYAASGNGAAYINGVAPTPTQVLSTAAPGVILVGAHDNGYVAAWSGAPAHVVADGYGGTHAHNQHPTAYRDHPFACCSSAASPYAAGGGAAVVLEARTLLDDRGTGLREVGGEKAVAVNTSRAGWYGGPLEDGILTLDEARHLVKATAEARPGEGVHDGLLHWMGSGDADGSADLIATYGVGANPYCQGCVTAPVAWSDIPAEAPAYASIGYGAVNERSVAAAKAVLRGDVPAPDRGDVDAFFEVEALVRAPFFADPPYAAGRILVGNPTSADVGGVSETHWATTGARTLQGVDGLVVELPEDAAGKTITAHGSTPYTDVGYDLDLYFYDAHRLVLDHRSATGAVDESTVVPEGAQYAFVDLWLGADVTVAVTLT